MLHNKQVKYGVINDVEFVSPYVVLYDTVHSKRACAKNSEENYEFKSFQDLN